MRTVRLFVLMLSLAAFAGRASAQAGFSFGQTFQTPGGAPVLAGVNTGLLGSWFSNGEPFSFYLYRFESNQLSGAAIWQYDLVSPVGFGLSLDINAALAPNTEYILMLNGPDMTMTHSSDFIPNGYAAICWDADCWASNGERDIDEFSLRYAPVGVVPEPLTLVLVGSGLAGIGAARRRRRARA